MDSNVPIIPAKAPKIKYNVPISLWFVEQNQRIKNLFTLFILIQRLS
jgi:hypothetical protein